MTKWSKISSSFSTKMPTLLDLFNNRSSDSPTRSVSSRIGDTGHATKSREEPAHGSRNGDDKMASKFREPSLGSYFLDEFFPHPSLPAVVQQRQGDNNEIITGSRRMLAERHISPYTAVCRVTTTNDNESIHSGTKSSQEEELVQCIDCRTFYPLPPSSSSSSQEVSCTSCQQMTERGSPSLSHKMMKKKPSRQLAFSRRPTSRTYQKDGPIHVSQPACRWMTTVTAPMPVQVQPQPEWSGDTLNSLERALSMVCQEEEEEEEEGYDSERSSSSSTSCWNGPSMSFHLSSESSRLSSSLFRQSTFSDNHDNDNNDHHHDHQHHYPAPRPSPGASGSGDSPPCVPRRRPSLSRNSPESSSSTTIIPKSTTTKRTSTCTFTVSSDLSSRRSSESLTTTLVERERLWVAAHRRWLYTLVHHWQRTGRPVLPPPQQQQQQQQQPQYWYPLKDPSLKEEDEEEDDDDQCSCPLPHSVRVKQPSSSTSSSSLSSSPTDDLTFSGRALTVYN